MTNYGWGGGIRTPECMDQNHVPYHLATPHCRRDNNRSTDYIHAPARRSAERVGGATPQRIQIIAEYKT